MPLSLLSFVAFLHWQTPIGCWKQQSAEVYTSNAAFWEGFRFSAVYHRPSLVWLGTVGTVGSTRYVGRYCAHSIMYETGTVCRKFTARFMHHNENILEFIVDQPGLTSTGWETSGLPTILEMVPLPAGPEEGGSNPRLGLRENRSQAVPSPGPDKATHQVLHVYQFPVHQCWGSVTFGADLDPWIRLLSSVTLKEGTDENGSGCGRWLSIGMWWSMFFYILIWLPSWINSISFSAYSSWLNSPHLTE